MPETGGTIEGFSSGFATIDEVRLHYWIGGDLGGQPVILWHGFLETSYAWRKVGPTLANAGMAVLIPDMRGYGSSDKPGGTQGYDGRALAEECRAGSCPTTWCRSGAPEQRWLRGQVVSSSRLMTCALWLTELRVSSVM